MKILTSVWPIYFIDPIIRAVRNCAKKLWPKWIPVPLAAVLLLARKTGQGVCAESPWHSYRLHLLPMLEDSTLLPDTFWVCCPPWMLVPSSLAWHGRLPAEVHAWWPMVPASGIRAAFCMGAGSWKMRDWFLGKAAPLRQDQCSS